MYGQEADVLVFICQTQPLCILQREQYPCLFIGHSISGENLNVCIRVKVFTLLYI